MGYGRAPTTSLIDDVEELTDCFEDYYDLQHKTGEPLDLYTWFAYGQRHLGIGRRWWGMIMRCDKDACKLEGLREACAGIEDVIAGHLSSESLKNKLNPNLVTNQLNLMERRDELAEVKRAQQEAEKALRDTPTNPPADILHPDMSYQQLQQIEAAGFKPLLYTQAQLEAGVPHYYPAGYVPVEDAQVLEDD